MLQMLRVANALGCRVIRGKDWEWDDEDGGPGFAGTVIGLGRSGHERSCAGTVEVCWDWGLRSNYRAGFQGKYDLRVIDTAQCGVVHVSVSCDSCKKKDIRGLRFKCAICFDYDLCTRCYHNGDHDLEHPFVRCDKDAGHRVHLPPRLGEDRIEVRGIFKGAIVVRRNWNWLWKSYHEGPVEISMNPSKDISILENYHNGVRCDLCDHPSILGSRYKCTVCDNYDLCLDCYQDMEHHLHHPFTRFKRDKKRFPGPGEELSAREQGDTHWKGKNEDEETITYCDSCKQSSISPLYTHRIDKHCICGACLARLTAGRSLFSKVNNSAAKSSGLEVLKKNDWKWTNTDASNGVRGLLNCIFDAGNTGRSLAFVKWSDSTKNDYRVGDAGQMDLKCISAATGGNYYESHLPNLFLRQRWTAKSSTSHERLRELESKVEGLEEQITCPVCLEAPKAIAFQCGHSVCTGCSTKLDKCHICRKNIAGRLKLY